MKNLSKNTKNILTFLIFWACSYILFTGALIVMANSFNVGVAYIFTFIISGLLSSGILPKE